MNVLCETAGSRFFVEIQSQRVLNKFQTLLLYPTLSLPYTVHQDNGTSVLTIFRMQFFFPKNVSFLYPIK
jgi:hypothetical protein